MAILWDFFVAFVFLVGSDRVSSTVFLFIFNFYYLRVYKVQHKRTWRNSLRVDSHTGIGLPELFTYTQKELHTPQLTYFKVNEKLSRVCLGELYKEIIKVETHCSYSYCTAPVPDMYR